MGIKNLLKSKFKPWNGLCSLMEGGWRMIPIRMECGSISGAEEVLAKEIRSLLKRYSLKVSGINAFTMFLDGTIGMQLKKDMFKKS